MKISKLLKSNRGITLIELLVVVVILGIIAAVVIPIVSGNQEDAYINTNQQNLKIVQDAKERYVIGVGSDPALLDDLVSGYISEMPTIYDDSGDPVTAGVDGAAGTGFTYDGTGGPIGLHADAAQP